MSENMKRDFEIQTILSFLKGEYAFVAVNRAWKNKYISMYEEKETNISFADITPEQMRYTIQMNYLICDQTYKDLARFGNIKTLMYLYNKIPYWGSEICREAAKGGHIMIIKWAFDVGLPCTRSACIAAAEYGHLEILKWLRSKGIPWDETASEMAARQGHLDILEWAYLNGCKLSDWILIYAIEGLQPDAIRWANCHGYDWNIREAIALGYIEEEVVEEAIALGYIEEEVEEMSDEEKK